MSEPSKFSLPTGEITVVAFVRAKGGKEAKIQEVTTKLQEEVRQKNPGAVIFQAYKGSDEPGLILFYEIYKTREAFQFHKDSAHLQRWFDAIEPLADGRVHVMVVDPLSPIS